MPVMWCFCAQLELSNTDCSKFPSPSERHLGGPSLLFCCTMALVVHCPAAFVPRSWGLGRQQSWVQQSTRCWICGTAHRALALGAEHTEPLGSERSSSPHSRAPPPWPGAAGWLHIRYKAKALDLFQARPRSHIACLCGLLASTATVQGSVGASHSCLAKNSFNILPLFSVQILYGMMPRDLSTPFVLSQEGFGHLKAISLCNLRLPSVQAPVLFTSPAVEAALPGLCA